MRALAVVIAVSLAAAALVAACPLTREQENNLRRCIHTYRRLTSPPSADRCGLDAAGVEALRSRATVGWGMSDSDDFQEFYDYYNSHGNTFPPCNEGLERQVHDWFCLGFLQMTSYQLDISELTQQVAQETALSLVSEVSTANREVANSGAAGISTSVDRIADAISKVEEGATRVRETLDLATDIHAAVNAAEAWDHDAEAYRRAVARGASGPDLERAGTAYARAAANFIGAMRPWAGRLPPPIGTITSSMLAVVQNIPLFMANVVYSRVRRLEEIHAAGAVVRCRGLRQDCIIIRCPDGRSITLSREEAAADRTAAAAATGTDGTRVAAAAVPPVAPVAPGAAAAPTAAAPTVVASAAPPPPPPPPPGTLAPVAAPQQTTAAPTAAVA